MRVNHTWQAAKQRTPKYIPEDQHRLILQSTQNNTAQFTVSMVSDLALLALHDAYGFGKDRNRVFLQALADRIRWYEDNVQWEYDAETTGMKLREKEQAAISLDYLWEILDRELEPITPPEQWQPGRERYAGFGGRGTWCKDD